MYCFQWWINIYDNNTFINIVKDVRKIFHCSKYIDKTTDIYSQSIFKWSLHNNTHQFLQQEGPTHIPHILYTTDWLCKSSSNFHPTKIEKSQEKHLNKHIDVMRIAIAFKDILVESTCVCKEIQTNTCSVEAGPKQNTHICGQHTPRICIYVCCKS